MNSKTMALGATAGVLALALSCTPAMAATIFPVGSSHFFLTSGTPTTPTITAVFFDGFSKSTAFDDIFQFTIPQNGVGSGSISTSFSSPKNKLVITDLLINGVHYVVPSNPSGQSFTANGITILNGVMNTIEVIGSVKKSGTYAGTATFEATVVPEISTWGMMVVGFGLVGAVLRRRQGGSSFA